MGRRADAERVKKAIDGFNTGYPTSIGELVYMYFSGIDGLKRIVDRGLALQQPQGNPTALNTRLGTYNSVVPPADAIGVDVRSIALDKLPEIWVGKASERAREVVGAVGHDLGDLITTYSAASKELSALVIGLQFGQHMHTTGHGILQGVRTDLDGLSDPFDFGRMQALKSRAQSALQIIVSGAIIAERAGMTAASRFNDLASKARAGTMNTGNLSASDKLVLTEAAVPGAAGAENDILTNNDAKRADQRLDKLSEDDRRRFNDLLSNAKSPQERAYLTKALAAGHNMDKIEGFDKLIHDHGNDPAWLRDHLTPVYNSVNDTTTGTTTNVDYKGRQWTQGQHPTCVASSTVTARAMVDPLYALQLTSGGHPDDPAYDTADKFGERLRNEQVRVYDGGRSFYADWWAVGYDGMKQGEGEEIANNEISPYTGGSYDSRDLDNADERRAALYEVEKAVDEGKPVPIQVRNSDSGHQMMVIGHDGDRLQIYNPWGNTVWVSEDDWINGHMDKAGPKLPNVEGVHLPRN
jgi:hypothetical protein